ncbi:MAG: FGGY-family carbohydrate kinase [Actinomycetota bacterium]
MSAAAASARAAIEGGRTSLGIELGSTRIKAVLVALDGSTLATASFGWESELRDGRWTYALEAVDAGVREVYARLLGEAERAHGIRPTTFGALGVSAMMHGYLPFDADDRLLVPFRTWRNSSTGAAAAELSAAFGSNVPLRWSAAHLLQAVIDREPHVADIRSLTTLAGYVHRRLTGRHVLGAGDASGMLPLDASGARFDPAAVSAFDERAASHGAPGMAIAELLPEVLLAGADAGSLTDEGAAYLDPTGALQPGVPLCPPEGDAGTGMVATAAVAPGTGNVSVGTSVFAMLVLDAPLAHPHAEIDIVATPSGDPVAMVHCNNGAGELDAWAGMLGSFAAAIGHPVEPDAVFEALLGSAVEGDAQGIVLYNYLAGEHSMGVDEGRPLLVRLPGTPLTLGGFAKAQLLSTFATLRRGMRVLADEGVRVDEIVAHGGVFRTAGAAQALLAASLDAPVVLRSGASEGGAWGMALLGAFRVVHPDAPRDALGAWLVELAGDGGETVEPDAALVRECADWFARWEAAFELERRAAEIVR